MSESRASIDRWVSRRPFLARLGGLARVLEAVGTGAPPTVLAVPDFEARARDHRGGEPLLSDPALDGTLDAAAAPRLGELARRLAESDDAVPPRLSSACRSLADRLASEPSLGAALLAAARRGEVPDVPGVDPGIVVHLAWTALRQVLAPVAERFEAWRAGEPWDHPHCPTCGALPGMARLVRSARGRERVLACGRCGTRWGWRRLGCPFCGADDQLGVLELESEQDFRLDVCRACKGYVKTCTSAADDALALADWSTLHLDVAAVEAGYRRRGASLYEL